MTVIPTPPAAGPDPGQPGHYAHHDWLEASALALDDAASPPRVGLARATSFALATNAWTVIAWDTILYNPHGMFTSGSQIVVSKPGLYHIDASIHVTYAASQRVGCSIRLNGSTTGHKEMLATAGPSHCSAGLSADVELLEGNYFTISGYTSVASPGIVNAVPQLNFVNARWVAPLSSAATALPGPPVAPGVQPV